jgi:hypothetical protein
MSDAAQIENVALKWRSFLEENLDALLEGVPKRPDGWWKEPARCPVCWMFEMFPVLRPQ